MKKIDFEKIFKNLGIKKKDKILISSNLLKMIISKKRGNIKFEIKDIIDKLIEVIKKDGTILVPTFNWDFCRGLGFHYKKTLSHSGSLGNYVLKRKDFKRTKNPIYSFAVYGKDQEYLSNLDNKSCFESNSPFGYMAKQNVKNLYIDIDNIYEDSFTLCHLVEQEVGVSYRFLKNFSGPYVHSDLKSKEKSYSMYVRKLNLKIKTGVNPIMRKELIKKKSYIEKEFNKVNFKVVKMKAAYEIMKNSLLNKGNIIFKQKL